MHWVLIILAAGQGYGSVPAIGSIPLADRPACEQASKAVLDRQSALGAHTPAVLYAPDRSEVK